MLRKSGSESTPIPNSSTEIENMKEKMEDMAKENQKLIAMAGRSNQILLQALDAIRVGKMSDDVFASAQPALRGDNYEVSLNYKFGASLLYLFIFVIYLREC